MCLSEDCGCTGAGANTAPTANVLRREVHPTPKQGPEHIVRPYVKPCRESGVEARSMVGRRAVGRSVDSPRSMAIGPFRRTVPASTAAAWTWRRTTVFDECARLGYSERRVGCGENVSVSGIGLRQ